MPTELFERLIGGCRTKDYDIAETRPVTELLPPTWELSFKAVRQVTDEICQPLEIKDYVIQAIEDVSPPKLHMAHTTWFYEQVILERLAYVQRLGADPHGVLLQVSRVRHPQSGRVKPASRS